MRMYEFWYGYGKLRCREKVKSCYTDKDCFLVYIKTDDIYKDIAEDVDTRFDTSNYETDRPLPQEKIKKLIGLIKDELGRKTMTKFIGLKPKTYINLIDDDREDKKSKRHKKVSHKKN